MFRNFWLQVLKSEWQKETMGKHKEEIKAQPK